MVAALWPLKIVDPRAFGYSGIHWELYRCCLLRTLMSYEGRPGDEGELILKPDLAVDQPEISEDGLTWTFRLRQGLRYAPPFGDTEIVAADVVRSFERLGDPGMPAPALSFASYFTMIGGFERFHEGAADTIAGLETPDEHTLVVHLTQPTGDLGYRFSIPATAPVPEGAAAGHETDYLRYLVASGPYMIEGSDALDFSLPPDEQAPVSGFVPERSLTLIRNPSWKAGTDPLRPAYVDRMEIELRPMAILGDPSTTREIAALVDGGAFDLSNWAVLPSQLRRYRVDLALRDRILTVPQLTFYFMPMNLAMPPFDDVHVRRAVFLATDREAIADGMSRLRPDKPASVVWHVFPDAIEGELVPDGWRPDWMPPVDATGDVEAARAEMALSHYDHDGDGRCDDVVCQDVPTVIQTEDNERSLMWWWESVRHDLSAIGIGLTPIELSCLGAVRRLGRPADHTAFSMSTCTGWGPDFPNASTFAPLIDGRSIVETGNVNRSLLGATFEQLQGWGYEVSTVPSLDGRVDRCMSQAGIAQVRCWASLDQYLVDEIVPWVPLYTESRAFLASERVAHWSPDPYNGRPAFDRIALVPGSE
jgi:peptide/nickel transport system substrate-binding protein